MPATASTARHPRTNTLRLSEGPLKGSTARTKGSAGPLRGSRAVEQELCGRGLRTQRATCGCGRVRTSRGLRGPAERSLCRSTPQHIKYTTRRGGGHVTCWFHGSRELKRQGSRSRLGPSWHGQMSGYFFALRGPARHNLLVVAPRAPVGPLDGLCGCSRARNMIPGVQFTPS